MLDAQSARVIQPRISIGLAHVVGRNASELGRPCSMAIGFILKVLSLTSTVIASVVAVTFFPQYRKFSDSWDPMSNLPQKWVHLLLSFRLHPENFSLWVFFLRNVLEKKLWDATNPVVSASPPRRFQNPRPESHNREIGTLTNIS